MSFCHGLLLRADNDTGKIFRKLQRYEEAKECQTDATSCQKAGNVGHRERYAYMCRILRISPRTLRIMRDNRAIGFTQVNRKFYYKPEEVERLLKGAALQRYEREET